MAAVLLFCCLFSTIGCANEPALSPSSAVSCEGTATDVPSDAASSAFSSEDTASEIAYETIPFTLGFGTTGVCSDDWSSLEFEARLIEKASDLPSQLDVSREYNPEGLNAYVDSLGEAFFKENALLAIKIYLGTVASVPQVNFLAWSEQGLIVDYTIMTPFIVLTADGNRLILLEVKKDDLKRRPKILIPQCHTRFFADGEFENYDLGIWASYP